MVEIASRRRESSSSSIELVRVVGGGYGGHVSDVQQQNGRVDVGKKQEGEGRDRSTTNVKDGRSEIRSSLIYQNLDRGSREFSSLVVERRKWWKIYGLHFLFTWNSRTYEYASIVLVAMAFPHSLTAASIRGIASTIGSILFAPVVGSWIDRSQTRIKPMLISLSINHGAMILAYLAWILWPHFAGPHPADSIADHSPFSSASGILTFGIILILDVLEVLSSIANRLSVDRDWVPTLVGSITPDSNYGLTQVNSVMSRVDLACMVVAPSLLPFVISSFSSRTGWILLLVVTTIIIWVVEISCARIIAREHPQLHLPKDLSKFDLADHAWDRPQVYLSLRSRLDDWYRRGYWHLYQNPAIRMKHFFSMPIWPASMSKSFLHFTVLVYSATLITYLLQVGFSLSAVTIARGSGSLMGFAGTFATPLAVRYIGKHEPQKVSDQTNLHDDSGERIIVRKVGVMGLSVQFLVLIPVVMVLWNLSPKSTGTISPSDPASNSSVPQLHSIVPLILFTFLSLSRVGHWVYALMVQEIEQVEIPASQRSTYAGTGQSFHSFFDLLHWGATVVWNRPEQFKWLALTSLCVLGGSVSLFANWAARTPSFVTERGYYHAIGIADEDGDEK